MKNALGPATTRYGTIALVIPGEAKGSAVRRAPSWKCFRRSVPQPVPKGRLNLAQDAVLGRDSKEEKSRKDDWNLPEDLYSDLRIPDRLPRIHDDVSVIFNPLAAQTEHSSLAVKRSSKSSHSRGPSPHWQNRKSIPRSIRVRNGFLSHDECERIYWETAFALLVFL